jgi:hypothetical protein
VQVNASRALLDGIGKSMREIHSIIGATTINPKLLSAAERIQYGALSSPGVDQRRYFGASERRLAAQADCRQTGHSRGLVRRVARGERNNVFRIRQSSLELYLPWLDEQWAAG